MAERVLAPFKPLPWQVQAWRDKSPALLLTGSAGGGKSRLAAEKVHAYCLKYPGATALLVRKAREWTGRSIIPFFWDTVVGHDSRVHFNRSASTFEYENGSVVYVGGMLDEAQREAIRSIGGSGGLDIAWMEEANAFTRQDFDELRARLRHNAADWRQIILTTNPGAARHWIKTDLMDGGLASVYLSGAADNPHNPADYLGVLDSLTGTLRERLALGIWATAEGAVYQFERATHVQEREPRELRDWYIFVDEGYTNPAVLLLVGQDGDGRLHVLREWYKSGQLEATVVEQARRWTREMGVSGIYVDDAAASLIAALRHAGLPAQAAHKARVIDGIRAVQEVLRVRGDGRPRLTVSPDCTYTINEFETYVFKPGTEEPVKENDHAMDALRYGVTALATVEHVVTVWDDNLGVRIGY